MPTSFTVETFPSPPTTLVSSIDQICPSLSRRTSRRSSDYSCTPLVVSESLSPDVAGGFIGNSRVSAPIPTIAPSHPPHHCPRINGANFGLSPSSSTADSVMSSTDNEDDEDYGGSLTEQLAETAVGVREMSKQLGQCLRLRPKAHDQPLIITSF